MSKIAKNVIETPAVEQLSKSFLEYGMSVVYSRALPDARDGLKPVQRRLIHTMVNVDKLLPSGNYVKSAKPVASTMGLFHPHGDSSIYQALVKLAQPFYLNVPYVDGYGNWGDVSGSSAAASRYTECKLRPEALLLASEVNEGSVDLRPNYDDQLEEPVVLPAQFPALLINGAFGIGVGFANLSVPNNPSEVMESVRYVLKNPKAKLDDVMKYMPGPDFPTGGVIIGVDGIRDSYETGTGKFRIQARYKIVPAARGRSEIIFNELPYGTSTSVTTAKIIEEIKDAMKNGKLMGLYDAKDLTDRKNGLRIVVETKAGVKPEVLLQELFATTSLEISCSVNNTVLVDGSPKTIGVLETIHIFLNFRRDVVKRRSTSRREKRAARLHLVDGLLKALANIDEVIRIVRGADNVAIASEKLIKKFKIDEIQAAYILDIPLRRLTKLDQIELQNEKKKLENEIAELDKILNDPKVLDATIYKELGEVAKIVTRDRKTTIVGGTLAEHVEAAKEAVANVAAGVEIADEPCYVSLTPKWNIIRTSSVPKRSMRNTVATTTKSRFVVVTSKGRGFKVDTLHVGEKEAKFDTVIPSSLARGERVVAVVPLELEEGAAGGVAVGTKKGVVKITAPQWPKTLDEFTVISLDKDDEVVNAGWVSDVNKYELVFVSSDSSFLTFPATKVRPQGLSGGGMAGISLKPGATVVGFNIVETVNKDKYVVVVHTDKAIKATKFDGTLYPSKGRATGGYASYSFVKGESGLVRAAVTTGGVLLNDTGVEVKLPAMVNKRVASGTKIAQEGIF